MTAYQGKLRSYDVWLNSLLALATCVAMGVVYALVFLPADLQLQHVQSQTIVLQETVQQTSAISQEQRTLEQGLLKSERLAADLLLRIPIAPRESDFLAQVSHLAGEVGLEVIDYRTGATFVMENHREMEVRMSTRGKYPALCKFMEQVDHLPRLSRVTNLDIQQTDRSPPPGAAPPTDAAPPVEADLAAEFVFRIYFAPPADATSTKKG